MTSNTKSETKGNSNPEANADELGASVDDCSYGAINWLISPPSCWGKNALNALLRFMKDTFHDSARLLIGDIDIASDHSPETLMNVGRFKLELSSSLQENTLDPVSFEGAGEISYLDGHKPLLIFLFLEKKFHEKWINQDDPLVSLCDEQGNMIRYRDFNSLESIIFKMGFDYNEVRSDAAKLGLAVELVNWSEIHTDIDDCFF